IQLDPSVDVNGLALSASGKIIARALQQYGAYVGDFSGAVSLYADASPDAQSAWNGGLLKNGEVGALDLKKLRVLTIGALFEDTNYDDVDGIAGGRVLRTFLRRPRGPAQPAAALGSSF